MGAVTGTKVALTELAGHYKVLTLTTTLASASDTITLTEAVHGVTVIDAIMGLVLTGGQDAALMAASASYSGLVVTVVSVNQAGTASTDWTSTTIALTLLCH